LSSTPGAAKTVVPAVMTARAQQIATRATRRTPALRKLPRMPPNHSRTPLGFNRPQPSHPQPRISPIAIIPILSDRPSFMKPLLSSNPAASAHLCVLGVSALSFSAIRISNHLRRSNSPLQAIDLHGFTFLSEHPL